MHCNFIGGEWVAGPGSRRNIDPSNLADLVGLYTQGDASQTSTAIQAAMALFAAWSNGPIQARADALEKVAAELLARRD